MKIAVVDLQGYALPEEFILKEITIHVGDKHGHFLLKPPYPFSQLSERNRRIVNLAENKLIGIRYDYGLIAYEELDSILQYYLSDVHFVYVRGHQKYDFLQEKLTDTWNDVKLVNIERISISNPPKIVINDTSSVCPYHMHGLYRCTEINVKNIHNWLVNILPQ